MPYNNIERKRDLIKKTMYGSFIFFYVLRSIIHIGYPLLFFSVFNNFINDTEKIFNSSTTNSSISYDRMFYIFILLQTVFVGILDIFSIFMKTTSKNRVIISSGSAVYSCLVASFYLILFHSFSEYEKTDLNFFQYVGFSEILTIIIWVFLVGIYIIEEILNRSLSTYKDTQEELLDERN